MRLEAVKLGKQLDKSNQFPILNHQFRKILDPRVCRTPKKRTVPFPNSIFSKKNKKTPEQTTREFEKSPEG
jgi:hypothetical protein